MREKDLEKYKNLTSKLEIENSFRNLNLLNKHAQIFILALCLLLRWLQADEAILTLVFKRNDFSPPPV